MKKKLNVFLSFFLLAQPVFSYAEIDQDQKNIVASIYNELSLNQDRPKSDPNHHPLQGIKKFNLFSAIPAESVETYEKIWEIIKKELSKYGKVATFDLLVKTPQGEEEINFSPLLGGTYMNYRIIDVYSPSGDKLGFVRASLTIEANVTINKAKLDTSVYIWNRSCFLPGSTEKDLPLLVKKSFDYLFQDFSEDYKIANKEDPLFNFNHI